VNAKTHRSKPAELLRRWIVFEGIFVLTLLPAVLGLSVVPGLAEFPRFFNAAWAWEIMAISPGGFARTDFDGAIYFSDWAWLMSLGLWGAAGFAYAGLLLRVRLAYCAVIMVPAVIATGLAAQLLLTAFGFASYAGV
jgi:hypothetical protein